jgi:tetrahydromethanopterin S-methyltransferase subunit F
MEISNLLSRKGGFDMDQTTIIRIAAGVLFAIVLVILIQRRRTQVK